MDTVHDLAPFLDRCFLFDAVEDSYRITDVSGRIPDWIHGTYYINGPSRFERSGLRYRHWLDGDGMVCALRFEPGSVHFTNRFVRTAKLKEEESAGHAVYRSFGTRFPGDRLKRGVMLEPPVNVSVYKYAGKLLAFGEQALPFELDPVTLETRGEYDFHGKLTEVSPFSAHPKWDPATGNMVNFGISFSPARPTMNVYEFDSGGCLIRRRRHALEHQNSNHDFALSRHYVVFYLSPLIMDFNRFWGEHLSVIESLRWDASLGSKLLVAPRESRAEGAFLLEVGQGYCLHLINCFEGNEGILTTDVLELESPVYPEYQPVPDLFSTVTRCRPVRYVIHVPSRKLLERRSMEYDRGPDFPSLDRKLTGGSYDDFWMLGISATGGPGRKFFDQLAHGSWEKGSVSDIYQTQPGQYLAGEPCLVTNPGDKHEALIINEFIDARNDRAEILLFEARNVSAGPVARLALRHKIHPGFHTSFHRA
ncbi:MAG TPA: carotenoid oxygenase family protein [Acidobacteriota bacterium]|nr:carotenoid oxygenase family protein [Acidobacteriota bacterium]